MELKQLANQTVEVLIRKAQREELQWTPALRGIGYATEINGDKIEVIQYIGNNVLEVTINNRELPVEQEKIATLLGMIKLKANQKRDVELTGVLTRWLEENDK